MKLDLYFTPLQIQDELQVEGKTAVVIDVLRASTTIAVALKNGARAIIPAGTVEEALKYSASIRSDVVLLCGERGGRIIDGFDVGNSPSEYTPDRVRGKTLIYASTNGSVAILKTKYARHSIIAGFVNISKVVEFLRENSDDILILCSGKLNRFCIEDAVCGGMIASKLVNGVRKLKNLSDSVTAAMTLYKVYRRNILSMLKRSEHGRFLIKLGFADDLKICADIDSVPVLPYYSEGVIRKFG
jgi:2-phosphosulfolactate phosphatase